MSFVKAVSAAFIAVSLTASLAQATPVAAGDSPAAALAVSHDAPVAQALVTPASTYGSAVQLYHSKAVAEETEAKKKESFLSKVPLPPAVLLFGAALGAIGWLGHRRKPDRSIRD